MFYLPSDRSGIAGGGGHIRETCGLGGGAPRQLPQVGHHVGSGTRVFGGEGPVHQPLLLRPLEGDSVVLAACYRSAGLRGTIRPPQEGQDLSLGTGAVGGEFSLPCPGGDAFLQSPHHRLSEPVGGLHVRHQVVVVDGGVGQLAVVVADLDCLPLCLCPGIVDIRHASIPKGGIPDIRYTGGDGHSGQLLQTPKGAIRNAGHAGGNRQLRHGPQHMGRILPGDGENTCSGITYGSVLHNGRVTFFSVVRIGGVVVASDVMQIEFSAPFLGHVLHKMQKLMDIYLHCPRSTSRNKMLLTILPVYAVDC